MTSPRTQPKVEADTKADSKPYDFEQAIRELRESQDALLRQEIVVREREQRNIFVRLVRSIAVP